MDTKGPFDSVLQSEPPEPRDFAATVIVVIGVGLGLLLLILVLPPISILDGGGGSAISGPVVTTIREDLPPPPEGFDAASALFDLSSAAPVRLPVRLTVNLVTPVAEGAQLVFFSYQDGSWRRLAEAEPVAGGTAAQGEVPVLPSNVAVMRPSEQARVVVGTVRAGREVDPRALAEIAGLRLTGFAPAADGRISGGPLQIPAGVELDVTAVIGTSTATEIEAINGILASPELADAHVQAIVDLVANGGLAGAHLDYGIVDRSNTESFTEFVASLSSDLTSAGRTLSLTLPSPVLEGAEWDTLGFDWPTLALHVESITLDLDVPPDGYYARAEAVLGYVVPQVGGNKLRLSVGPSSQERGVDGFRSLTLTEALSLASTPSLQQEGPVAPETTVQALGLNVAIESGASGLYWDDNARAVTFTYIGPGGERTVWLTNRFSEAFRLDLASRYRLGGVVVEDVSDDASDANIWPAVVQYVQAGEVDLVTPNGDLLEPRWTATGGVLITDAGAQVGWKAPAEFGTYVLTLTVSDGVLRVGQELQVSVETPQGVLSP